MLIFIHDLIALVPLELFECIFLIVCLRLFLFFPELDYSEIPYASPFIPFFYHYYDEVQILIFLSHPRSLLLFILSVFLRGAADQLQLLLPSSSILFKNIQHLQLISYGILHDLLLLIFHSLKCRYSLLIFLEV